MISFRKEREYSAFSYFHRGTPRDIVTDAKVRVPDIFPKRSYEYVSTLALWDTGATNTVLSAALAQQLGLPAISRTEIHGVNGLSQVDVFVVDILLMDKVSFGLWRVTSGETGPSSPGLLIGMDIIAKGDFTLTKKNGIYVFSFVIPSSESTIDFKADLDHHMKTASRDQPHRARPKRKRK